MQPTPEESEFLARAKAFHELSSCLGWKYMLDEAALYCDSALTELRLCPVNDFEKMRGLAMQWRERENMLTFLQNLVLGTIESANQLQDEINTASKRLELLLKLKSTKEKQNKDGTQS